MLGISNAEETTKNIREWGKVVKAAMGLKGL